jgi:hypothetical protein
MASITWTGAAGDGNWNTGGNWLGSAAPAGADDVIFDRGSYNVTTGPSSAINVTLKVTAGYTGSWIATITLGTISAFNFAGSGATYNLSATVTKCMAYIIRGTTLQAVGGTWTNTYVSGQRGGYFYKTAATLTNLYSRNVNVEFTSGGSASTIVQMSNGSFTTALNPGTFTSKGKNQVVVTGSAAPTSVMLAAGDVYNHLSSGTIGTLDLVPESSFPCVGAFNNFTISQLNTWPDSYINRYPPGVTITISAETAYGFQGGGGQGSIGLG